MPVPIAAFSSPIESFVNDGRQSEAARLVQRGVGRLLAGHGFSILYELPLASGRRADVVALGGNGDILIIEIKSSVEDFRTDRKWPDYRLHCDRLFFATHADVPTDIFPEEAGLIVADGYGGAILREAPNHRLAAATRRAVTLRFAQVAARRIQQLIDPQLPDMGAF
ncbi:MmcB family DNA repair protein [Pleomorphomonas sp. JP5]|uniref:MmcB family DNA repair protein n=1 Tax=Pleomorphomonas sp. JP5 TaxID=2942998 RepID=UPI0020444B89|nr:MmcB family DNA repair protein [Pleomorphomonas sp. JP5]MCM5559592.1 MmcB family DNA repair protein [Pleomorphomonas sp. JP5]